MILARPKSLSVVFLCVALTGCTKRPRYTSADVAQRIFGGSEHMAALTAAHSATAYDLDAKMDSADSVYEPFTRVYVKGKSTLLSDAQLTLVKQLFQKPSSYAFDQGSLCIPHDDVLFVFHTSPRDIFVGICFTCDQLVVLEGDQMLNSQSDFHPMRPQLLSLSKTLFKNDPEIQRLQ
jgi:hypothetical protein